MWWVVVIPATTRRRADLALALRKVPQARGFPVDENMPPAVSDYIAHKGYRVAHIGRQEPYLGAAPTKGTEDPRLRPAVRDSVLVTGDKRLLNPGRFPNDHRGIIVLDGEADGFVALLRVLFRNTDWKRNPLLVSRRFPLSAGGLHEVLRDETRIPLAWPLP